MTVRTKAYNLVGTVAYRARVLTMIPLDDPNGFGNMGLEGFDEEYESRDFKTKAAAVRWIGQQFKSDPERRFNAEVEKVEWERDEFPDDRYGMILDGIENVTYRWYYTNDDSKARLDDECEVREGW